MDPGTIQVLHTLFHLLLLAGWGAVGLRLLVVRRRHTSRERWQSLAGPFTAVAFLLVLHSLRLTLVHASAAGLLPGSWGAWARQGWVADLPWVGLLAAAVVGLGVVARWRPVMQRETEARYRALFEQAADSVVLFDLETGEMLEFNDRASANLGYTCEEFAGLSVADIDAIESPEDIARHFAQIAATGGDTFETKHRKKNGETVNVLVTARVVSLPGGKIIASIWRDISNRKRAEEALRQERDFSTSLIQASPAFFVAIGADGCTLMMNQAMLTDLGYTEDEVVGKNYLETFVPEPDREMLARIFDQLMHSNEPTLNENRVLAKDGRERQVEWHGRPVFREDGRFDYFFGVGIDITERKRAEGIRRELEEQLQDYAENLERKVFERTQELTRSEARYRNLYDAAPDLYLTLDPGETITDINRAVLETLGLPRDRIVGHQAREFVPETHHALLQAAAPVLRDSDNLENIECPLLRADGTRVETILKARTRRDEVGKVQEIRVVLRDITRRKDLHRQLVQTEKLATTGRLAASVAHEINNPLQAVLTHISLVDDALPAGFSERESWQRVREGVGRIREVVNDLLDLHRMDRREPERVDLNAVIREAAGLLESQLRSSGIDLRLDLAGDLPRVSGISQQLYQVVLNLLLNGAESMADGGRLMVSSHRAGPMVIAEIRDTGPGIPEEDLPDIFDPFLTGRKATGTGLGLFVTYNLVKDHRGDLEVESRLGEGTMFRVCLPAGAPDWVPRAV